MHFLIGLAIGALLGLTGAGGSVFAIPLLVYVAGFAPHEAVGISLGAVAIAAASGTAMRLPRREIQWLPAAVICITGVVAAPLGKSFGERIDPVLLMLSFGVLALLIAWRLWLTAPGALPRVPLHRPSDEPPFEWLCPLSPTGRFRWRPRCLGVLALGGAVTGLLSGLFGVGGGFFIVPLLIWVSGMPMQAAVATSLVIITLVAGSGFAAWIAGGVVVATAPLLWIAFGALAGMALGTVIAPRVAPSSLQKLFAVLLLLVAAGTTLESLLALGS